MTHTQESTPTLQPCPFCGGEAELHTDKGPTGELYGWVGCNECDAMSTHCDLRSMQPEEVHPVDAWNRRTPPASQSEALVTQADWDAAERYFSEANPADVFSGTELAQAFAQHRIAARREGIEEKNDA